VLEAIRAPFLATPAQTLDAPVLQPLGLLLDLAGETLRERLFVVQSLDGGPEACLRTDFTIPALRAHIASGKSCGRYVYAGHAFRRAPPGSSRAEEFPQIGLEAFEPGDQIVADAEIAALAWTAAAAGGREDLTLMMGDVGLFSAFVETLDLAPALAGRLARAFSSPRKLRAELQAAVTAADRAPRSGERLAGLLAGLPEAQGVAVLEDVLSLAGIEPVGGRSAAEIVHRLAERAELALSPHLTAGQSDLVTRFLGIAGEPEAALDAVAALAPATSQALDGARHAWAQRVAEMARAGVPPERVRFSAAFGRAFGYYDGMVFEVQSAGLVEAQPVAAGGRYDSLPAKLGAELPTGAVGCMVRPGRAWIGARP
jgi:ATP phosphoribosyltransferase regulatory subunit